MMSLTETETGHKLKKALEDIAKLQKHNQQLDDSVQRLTSVNASLRMDGNKQDTAFNSQKGGDHYQKMGDFQPWKVFPHWLNEDELKGFMKGTVIAYLAREQDKGGELDIEKAYHTLGLYLELKRG